MTVLAFALSAGCVACSIKRGMVKEPREDVEPEPPVIETGAPRFQVRQPLVPKNWICVPVYTNTQEL